MANYNTNLKTWGATGSEYPDGYNYVEDEQPVDAWDNYLTSNLVSDIQHLIALTNDRIESEKGGSGNEPASPEDGHFYYDQGNERLEVWNSATSSWETFAKLGGDTMQGVLDMGGYQIEDSNGKLTLAGTVNVSDNLQQNGNDVATEDWVNNNADVPNADYADNAGDADTLDGNSASDLENNIAAGTSEPDPANYAGWVDTGESPPLYKTHDGSSWVNPGASNTSSTEPQGDWVRIRDTFPDSKQQLTGLWITCDGFRIVNADGTYISSCDIMKPDNTTISLYTSQNAGDTDSYVPGYTFSIYVIEMTNGHGHSHLEILNNGHSHSHSI